MHSIALQMEFPLCKTNAMSTVLMTNPPPGLALAVIGNPGRQRRTRGGSAMATRHRHSTSAASAPVRRRRRAVRALAAAVAAAPALVRGRARAHARPRRNPNSVYWRVSSHTPWKTSASAVHERERQAMRAQKHPGVTVASVRRRVAARAVTTAKTTKKRSRPKSTGRIAPALRIISARSSKPGKRTKSRSPRRNPPPGYGQAGLMGDLRGLMPALMEVQRHPMGLLWLGGGAAGAVVGGGILNAQLGRVLPALSPMVARVVNALGYASTAALLSRAGRSPQARRQLLAGGLAVALVELMKPGITTPLVARIPGMNGLLVPASPMIAARSPAAQADETVKAAAVAATMPWYRTGGNANPLNWFNGVAGLADGEYANSMPPGIPIDGIAGLDGSYLPLLPAAGMTVQTATMPSDNLGCAVSVTGSMPMSTADGSTPAWAPALADGLLADGSGYQEPVATFLGDLSCPPSGRANDLNQLVRV